MINFLSVLLLTTLVTNGVSLETQVLDEFILGNNLFTSEVYKELTRNFDNNFLVSPFSVETILALTQSGAKGATAEELRQGLRLPNSNEKIENVFKSFLPQLRSNQYTLDSANKIYVKENVSISENFEKIATRVYDASIQNINFEKSVDAANVMNQWVEKQTKNKIKNLVSPSDLNDQTALVLINALYFQGNWTNPFDLLYTVPKKFYKTESDVVEVKTMQASKVFNYYECSEVDAKFLEMPFKGEEASMVIVLPNQKNGIANLESKIEKVFTPRDFAEELVQVAVPKFKIESTIKFNNVLENLGIKRIFNGTVSDLSGILAKGDRLAVSKVLQKTFIDVGEGGVEAAAATSATISLIISAAPPPPQPQKFFIADHPFIFYIKVRGVVLFGGRVSVPNA